MSEGGEGAVKGNGGLGKGKKEEKAMEKSKCGVVFIGHGRAPWRGFGGILSFWKGFGVLDDWITWMRRRFVWFQMIP